MLKNYFKIAWRNLTKHKSYSIINGLGLTLGIASCLIIFLVVKYELGYDRFNSKADRIYRVTLNAIDFNPNVSMAVVPAMRNDFPELEEVSQAWYHEMGLVKIGNKKFQEKAILFADKYFPSVFDYSWIEGDPATALADPNSIVLTESYVHKYFPGKEPMGQFIYLNNEYDLKVTGVIKDLPGNTHLPFNLLVSFETVRKQREQKGAMSNFYWINSGSFAYIVTPKHYDVSKIQRRIHWFIEKNWGKEIADGARLPLQPLTDIHFDPRYLNNTISYTTSRETYYVLTAVAVLIIIIACINFINLATAQAIQRAKEVGVRKVLGSTRRQLIFQFLSETSLMVAGALTLGLFLSYLLLPQLAKWLDIKLSTSGLADPDVAAVIFSSALFIVLLAGLYPSFVQSAFKPIESLKSKAQLSFKGLTLRKSLVVTQFAISQIMIVGTLVVAYQMDFFQNRNLGFNKDAVISFNIPDQNKTEVLREQLMKTPGVRQISFSSGAPVFNNNFAPFVSPEHGVTKDDVTELKFIDESYIDMFQMQLLAGDKIRRNNKSESDTVYDVLVNETLVHKLGIQDPQKAIGSHINVNNDYCTITGVVKDFQSESKHKKIRPCVLLYRTDNFHTASVKLALPHMNGTIGAIDKSWSALFPQEVFDYEFLDDHIAAWYRQEQKEYTAFKLFAIVAILIGCLGLYGLIAFATAQRAKEVGIRKVLGASLSSILLLFSREFVVLIAIAFLIAAPIAYYFMNNWLHGFAYQITIGPQIFAVAILTSFVIAGGTIAYQTIKAAVVNPVKSLRAE
ncbi:MAG TPA: ABC transporter permease [Chitinophagaceae bacterium]|nr:ABC transporter permease [Chitinophagaceae bacterium]